MPVLPGNVGRGQNWKTQVTRPLHYYHIIQYCLWYALATVPRLLGLRCCLRPLCFRWRWAPRVALASRRLTARFFLKLLLLLSPRRNFLLSCIYIYIYIERGRKKLAKKNQIYRERKTRERKTLAVSPSKLFLLSSSACSLRLCRRLFFFYRRKGGAAIYGPWLFFLPFVPWLRKRRRVWLASTLLKLS